MAIVPYMLCAGSSTFNQALFNSVNILMGVGLLSIPYALKEVSRQHHCRATPAGSRVASPNSIIILCAGRLGISRSAWPAVGLHQLHRQATCFCAWFSHGDMCPTWPGG